MKFSEEQIRDIIALKENLIEQIDKHQNAIEMLEKNLTILFITHNLVLAKRYADSIVVLRHGRTVGENDDYAKRLFRAGLLDGEAKSFIEV